MIGSLTLTLICILTLLRAAAVQAATVTETLFYEDFERITPLTAINPATLAPDWTFVRLDNNFTSEISNHTSQSGSRSAYICCGERHLTTRNIDLSGVDNARLSYWFRYGKDQWSGTDNQGSSFDSEDPSGNDHASVYYLSSNGTWHQIAFYEARLVYSGQVRAYSADLPADAFHSQFKVRFYQEDGTGSLVRRYDVYHIDDVLVTTEVNVGPDHFRLSYPSAALTCNPTTVTITACNDALCLTQYTDPVTVDLSPTGWSGGDSVTFSGGTGTADFYHTSGGTVSLGVSSSTPSASGSTLCSIDGGLHTGFCNLTYDDSGFIIDLPASMTANQQASGVAVRAVKTDDTQQCVPAFAGVTKTLNLWQDYDSPNTGTRRITVNGADVGASESAVTTQSLYFDSNGEAAVDVNYTDAGRMTLNVRYYGSGDDAGLQMDGAVQFVSVPDGLCVSASATCPAGDASCPGFAEAGSNFSLLVTPKAWTNDGTADVCDNPINTPNYTDTSLGLSSSLVAPSGGAVGSVTPISYNHALGDTSVTISQSEVGVFRFTVTPPNYLGHAFGPFTSDPIGRFYPASYWADLSEAGELGAANTAGANDFTYTGQDTGWLVAPQLEITARNSAGLITENFTQPGFMTLLASHFTVDAPTSDNTATGTGGSPLPVTVTTTAGSLSTSGTAGVVHFDLSAADTLNYDRSATAEVAPFAPDLTWVLSDITDADGVNLNSTLDITPVSNAQIRFGRLWLEDVYGPETENLSVPLRTEYFNGSRYILNTDDSDTTWDSSNATVTPSSLTNTGAAAGSLSGGRSDNDGILLLAPTGVAGTPDTGEATVDYAAPSYLQGDYDYDGSFEDPSAVASFGIYRGHSRRILKRELR